MKKVLAILFAILLMVVPCCIGVSAAGAINDYEQNILNALDQYVQLGKTKYHIPDEYITAAKNYFLTTEVTEQQSKDAIGYIDDAIDELKSTVLPNEEFHMEDLPFAVKQDILNFGQAAAATTGLSLSYNPKTDHIEIVKPSEDGSTQVMVFNNAPIVKTTGAEINTVAVTATVLAVVMVAAFVISKKVKLF